MLKEQEIFQSVVDNFVEQYNLEIKHPFGDAYMEVLSKDGQALGSLNPAGRNLLSNLSALVSMLQSDLL